MCYNPKVIAGAAVIGVGIWALAPGAVVTAFPFLLFLACPLSMWLMMRGMNRTGSGRVDERQIPASTDLSPSELKERLVRLDGEREDIVTRIAEREDAAGTAARPATTKSPGS